MKKMNNNLINQVVYTNSNCKDVWNMFIKQYEKHTKSKLFVTFCVIFLLKFLFDFKFKKNFSIPIYFLYLFINIYIYIYI